MRNVWILVASALLAFANFVKSQDTARNLYSSRYDNLDIDTILGSSRLVNNYVDCLLSRKPCPPEGKDLKRILPEALRTKCARCSATQKENALKIITTLYYQYPEQYMALRERWDPSGEYHRRFEEYIAGLQFNQIGSNGNDRPVRNDFDRDQSQVLLQTLILSTTTIAPPPPPPPSPLPSQNALPNGPEQPRPQQLAPSAQLTQPVAPVSLTSTTTASSTSTTTLPTTTTTSTTTEAATTTTRTTTTTTTAGTTSTVPSSSSMTNSAAAVGTTSRTVAPVINPRPTVGTLGNRFGGEDPSTASGSSATEFGTTAPSPAATVRPTTRPVVRQTTSRIVTPRPTPNRFGGGFGAVNNNNSQNNPNASPFVGLFNSIGNKLATTADAIAGMLRRTVDVLVSTHLQAHQQRRSVRSN